MLKKQQKKKEKKKSMLAIWSIHHAVGWPILGHLELPLNSWLCSACWTDGWDGQGYRHHHHNHHHAHFHHNHHSWNGLSAQSHGNSCQLAVLSLFWISAYSNTPFLQRVRKQKPIWGLKLHISIYQMILSIVTYMDKSLFYFIFLTCKSFI